MHHILSVLIIWNLSSYTIHVQLDAFSYLIKLSSYFSTCHTRPEGTCHYHTLSVQNQYHQTIKVFIQFMFLETSISLQFIPVKSLCRYHTQAINFQPHNKSPHPPGKSKFLQLNSFHKSLILFQMASSCSSKYKFPSIKKKKNRYALILY